MPIDRNADDLPPIPEIRCVGVIGAGQMGTGIAEGESVFYNHARPDLKLRSPHAFYSGYDPKSHRSLVILEDLAARGWADVAGARH